MPARALVDSSFFIETLKAKRDPLQVLIDHSEEWDFYTCGVVCIEVLRGLKHPKVHRRMEDFLHCMLYVPTTNRIWERAHRMAWQLDRQNRFVKVPDLTIGVCALEVQADVLTFDFDFLNIPHLRSIRALD